MGPNLGLIWSLRLALFCFSEIESVNFAEIVGSGYIVLLISLSLIVQIASLILGLLIFPPLSK